MDNKPTMEFDMRPFSRRRVTSCFGIFMALLAGSAWQVESAPAQTGDASPDLSIGAERYPDDDAVILRLEQDWTLDRDGTVHRRIHKWIKLFNSRPIRREADPRIDFQAGREKVKFHTARSHLPDGTTVDVPDYSFNKAAPGDLGGWPEYADWQQWIVSFSGIQDNVVLELDYEITTEPGVMPWVDADLAVHEEYPVVERIVSVTVPKGTTLHHQLERVPSRHSDFDKSSRGNSVTYRWTFSNLPADHAERQAPPWEVRVGRLRFTTVKNASSWLRPMLDAVVKSANSGDRLKACVDETIENEVGPVERARAIAEKLGDSFNFLDSSKSLRSLACRDAEEVFRSNYGNPLESAALLLAALRSAGLKAEPMVAVDAVEWDSEVPTDSAFEAVVLRVQLPDRNMLLHPQEGEFRNPGSWGRRVLMTVGDGGDINMTYVYARGERAPSEFNVTGGVKLDKTGKADGELRLQLTGLFYDPLRLATANAQERFVGGVASRVLSGFKVSAHSITALSDDEFQADVSIACDDALAQVGPGYLLRFAEGPAFLNDVPMPLDRSYRQAAVRLAGPFRERVDLVVQMPDGWAPSILPASPERVDGPWGYVEQKVSRDGDSVRLYRDIVVLDETVSPEDFKAVRRAVNDLRAAGSVLAMFEAVGDGKGL
jgi:hypothetical protein